MRFTEASFAERLTEALTLAAMGDETAAGEVLAELKVKNSVTFREAEILSDDGGVVVRLEDGTEFQVTIVQSR